MTETSEPQPPRPLTREDVLRLIEENGGTAQGLDLSGREFESMVNLEKLDLAGIVLKGALLQGANLEKALLFRFGGNSKLIASNLEGADLHDANLQGADLESANLQGAVLGEANLQGANLWGAKLQGAFLWDANLQGANLWGAKLQGADLENAKLQRAHLDSANLQGAHLDSAKLSSAFLYGADISTAHIEFADWSGGYYVGEEKQRQLSANVFATKFADAVHVYRALRTRYTQLGMGDTAGHFFYREKTAQRKAYWSGDYDSEGFGEAMRSRKLRAILRALWPQRPLPWLGFMFLNLLFGYGERPWRVVGWWVATIVASSLAYFAWGGLSFPEALYYSLVSFPALGYGNWVKEEIIQGWVRWAGPIEALWGVILVALFLTTFVRKMTR